ncbi:MAG: hypothetical protein ACRC10_13020 [Thermoguttaceae bacterium]
MQKKGLFFPLCVALLLFAFESPGSAASVRGQFWTPIPVPDVPAFPPSVSGTQKQGVQEQTQYGELSIQLPKNWPIDENGFENLALRPSAVAKSSSCIPGYDIHKTEHLNDGLFGNNHSWIAASNPCWAEIDLGEVFDVYAVAFGSDSTGQFQDRGTTLYTILVAVEYDMDSQSPVWKKVAPSDFPPNVQYRTVFQFEPIQARYVRVIIDQTSYGSSARIDELEVFGRKEPITPDDIVIGVDSNVAVNADSNNRGSAGFVKPVPMSVDADRLREEWLLSLVDEEYAWLKTFGRADIDPGLRNTPYPIKKHPIRVPEDETTLVFLTDDAQNKPVLDGKLDDSVWKRVSAGTVWVAKPGTYEEGVAVQSIVRAYVSGENIYVAVSTNRPLSGHVAVMQSARGAGIVTIGENDQLVWRKYNRSKKWVDSPLEGAVFRPQLTINEEIGDDLTEKGVGVGLADKVIGKDLRNKRVGAGLADKRTGKNLRENLQGKLEENSKENLQDNFQEKWYTFEFAVPLSLLPGIERGLAIRTGIGGRYTPNEGHAVYFAPSHLAVVPLGLISQNHVVQDGVVTDGVVKDSAANNRVGKNGAVRDRVDRVVKDGVDDADRFVVRLVNHGTCDLTVKGFNEVMSNGSVVQLVLQPGETRELQLVAEPGEIGPELNVDFSVQTSNPDEPTVSGALHLFQYDPIARSVRQLRAMLDRIPKSVIQPNVQAANEINAIVGNMRVWEIQFDCPEYRNRLLKVREIKRKLFFADPGLSDIASILFEKRFPLHPSHNYSDCYDSSWRTGGGIYTLDIPRENGRFVPEKAVLTELYQTKGMSRHPVANYDLSKIYFTDRLSADSFWHIVEMNRDGSEVRILTEGPYNDLWPCPLPDGDLAFITSRCTQKFLCWEPQALVLYRMNRNGQNLKRLSYANLTEFAPSVAKDGRIIWTRSEYLDKGADYGHTLWYIHPEGTGPELTFGNTVVLPQGYANGREVPDSREISCVMISHFGDLNGPVALLDIEKGRLNVDSIQSLTPEVPWPGFWARTETFREPFPISKNLFLLSHSSRDRFGLFVIDRFGNRELLYNDPQLGCMCPTPLKERTVPPVLPSVIDERLAEKELGVFMVADVYQGIEHAVKRGSAKYLRVCQEMPHFLEKYENGKYRETHQPYMEFYASPVDLVSGPNGWTSYVAKGDLGTVEIDENGSASFYAPSGAVLYFELLDENFNEIQRMRSVVQLQPGETRSCVGCHEDRNSSAIGAISSALNRKTPQMPTPSPWGIGPFDYQAVVQPVLEKKCVSCHSATDRQGGIDLSGNLDSNSIPSSFKTLIQGGFVHHFNWGYQAGVPTKAEPYTFGTVKSRLFPILEDHYGVELNEEEERAIKGWIDLSCPLWPDYTQRSLRGQPSAHTGTCPTP